MVADDERHPRVLLDVEDAGFVLRGATV